MAYLVICHDADLFVRNGADEMAVHTALQNGNCDSIPLVVLHPISTDVELM